MKIYDAVVRLNCISTLIHSAKSRWPVGETPFRPNRVENELCALLKRLMASVTSAV